MKLSARTRYASRILHEIARHDGTSPLAACKISLLTDISVQFVEQILKPLKQHGFTRSVRGAGGGHFLARRADAITLGDIVRLMEGGVRLAPCCGIKPILCPRKDTCVVRAAWVHVSSRTEQQLDAISLATLRQWEQGLANPALKSGEYCPAAARKTPLRSYGDKPVRHSAKRPGASPKPKHLPKRNKSVY